MTKQVLIAHYNALSIILRKTLLSKGCHVAMVDSEKEKLNKRNPELNVFSWDDLKENGIPRNIAAVVNMSYMPIFDPPEDLREGYAERLWDNHVTSSLHLAQAIEKTVERQRAPPDVFINMSSCDIYKQSDLELNEESAVGSDWVSHLFSEKEEAGRLADTIATRSVVIRHAAIIHTKEYPEIMNERKKVPLFPISLLSVNLKKPYITLHDLISLYVHCIMNEQSQGIYNAVSPQDISWLSLFAHNNQFSKMFFNEMKKENNRPRRQSVLYMSKRMCSRIKPMRTLQHGFKFNEIPEDSIDDFFFWAR